MATDELEAQTEEQINQHAINVADLLPHYPSLTREAATIFSNGLVHWLSTGRVMQALNNPVVLQALYAVGDEFSGMSTEERSAALPEKVWYVATIEPVWQLTQMQEMYAKNESYTATVFDKLVYCATNRAAAVNQLGSDLTSTPAFMLEVNMPDILFMWEEVTAFIRAVRKYLASSVYKLNAVPDQCWLPGIDYCTVYVPSGKLTGTVDGLKADR